MRLLINGNEVDCTENLTVSTLLVEQSVKMPEMVSVEVNGQVLRRDVFDTTELSEDDKVEFLYFMGGGSWV